MKYFDFHHHTYSRNFGIYNLKFNETPPFHCFSAGLHPDSLGDNLDEKIRWLQKTASSDHCVAIGECGLDARADGAESIQQEAFGKQILLANSLQKPLIIHCVNRFQDLIRFRKMAEVPMIVHGFNKRKTIGDELLRHQFHLSFGKSLLENVNLQDFFKETPLHRIFLETDSADAELNKIYEKAAGLKNITVEEMVLQIRESLKLIKFPI